MADALGPDIAPMVDIAEAVRAARNAAGLSQHKLAERAGVSRPSIARIEGGQNVNTQVLNKVLASLGLTLDIRDGTPASEKPEQRAGR